MQASTCAHAVTGGCNRATSLACAVLVPTYQLSFKGSTAFLRVWLAFLTMGPATQFVCIYGSGYRALELGHTAAVQCSILRSALQCAVQGQPTHSTVGAASCSVSCVQCICIALNCPNLVHLHCAALWLHSPTPLWTPTPHRTWATLHALTSTTNWCGCNDYVPQWVILLTLCVCCRR